MRRRRCTIDTSCLIALDMLGMIPRLSLLFEIVLVPRAVRRGFYKGRAVKDRMRRLFKDFAFVQPCNDYERVAVEVSAKPKCLMIDMTVQYLDRSGKAA